jgi:hypothetical protein
VAFFSLVLGTQFPDLVDKPASFFFNFGDGRALGHSLLFLVPLCLGVLLFTRRSRRTETGIAFTVGTLMHLPGDSWREISSPNPEFPTYLLFPLFPAPQYPSVNVVDRIQQIRFELRLIVRYPPRAWIDEPFVMQLVLGVCCGVLWAVDGFPGLSELWRWSHALLDRLPGPSRDRS